ncbi:hypothetical protein ACHWQZ_G014372 [Mnemiopsis leidyi]
MNVPWLKPGKRVKRQLSISGPVNFQHIEHIGADDVLTNNKKLSSSFQNIAELCRALCASQYQRSSATAELSALQPDQQLGFSAWSSKCRLC